MNPSGEEIRVYKETGQNGTYSGLAEQFEVRTSHPPRDVRALLLLLLGSDSAQFSSPARVFLS